MNIIRFFIEGFALARKALFANVVRTILTMLGVATSVFIISGILTMVNSMKRSVTENLASLGNTTMFVHNWPWTDSGDDWFKYYNRPKVSFRDYQKLKQNLEKEEVDAVAYQVKVFGQTAKYDGESATGVELVGVTTDFEKIADFPLAGGRLFSSLEDQYGSYVCVIGSEIKEALFPNTEATGKSIRVAGKQMKVIGVLKSVGIDTGLLDDDDIYLPYRTLSRMFSMDSRRIDKVIAVKIKDYEQMEYMENEIIGIMRSARGLKPRAENNFSINKQEMIMNQIDQIFGVMENAGWIISICSIFIAVFTIGCIMYISVRERTKEIGIQKALGSTRPFILYQILTESVLICLLGGLIGMLAVWGLITGVQALIDSNDMPLQMAISSGDIMFAFGFSSCIGLLAGLIPSVLASIVDPVIAMRHT